LADFPADVQVPQAERGFIVALFLPQETPGRFSSSAYPAHILVLFPDLVVVAAHPSVQRLEHWIPIDHIVWMESKRYLLDGALTLQTREHRYTYQFNARDSHAVDEFLAPLRARIMPQARQKKVAAPTAYGASLDLKFTHAERTWLEPNEKLRLRFFSPPVQHSRGRLLFRKVEWSAGDYVAFTNHRILWLTDRNGPLRDAYGITLLESPLSRMSKLSVTSEGDSGRLEIVFDPGLAWHIPVRAEWLEQAKGFVRDGQSVGARVNGGYQFGPRILG
jgi:hypothetical protein